MKKVLILSIFALCSCAGQTISEYSLSTKKVYTQAKAQIDTDSIVRTKLAFNKEGVIFNETEKTLSINGKFLKVLPTVEYRKWQNQELYFTVNGLFVEQHEVITHNNEMSRYASYGFYEKNKHLYEVQVIVTYNEITKITVKTVVVDNAVTYKSKTFRL
jgi:hypothetical protein